MPDVIFITIIVAFFAASAALVRFSARPAGGRRPSAMNWVYWLSGVAALVIFVYLIVALFKPEKFE